MVTLLIARPITFNIIRRLYGSDECSISVRSVELKRVVTLRPFLLLLLRLRIELVSFNQPSYHTEGCLHGATLKHSVPVSSDGWGLVMLHTDNVF